MSIIAAYYYNEGKRVREIALDEHVKLGESLGLLLDRA
jgi:magnesium transporter